jgi:HD superfamily phosphohydrolase
LDADRCDYLLRDGRNYGFEFATYDLARLLASIQVVMEEDGFRTVVDARGTSAAESFVLARFRSYQFSVRHHKVAQVAAALRHVSKNLLLQRADHFPQFIADVGAAGTAVNDHGASITDPAALLDRFSDYDDIWWMNELRSAAQEAPNDEWLALVSRRSPGPRSLWKRVEVFSTLVAPKSVRHWNLALPIQPEDEAAWRAAVRHLAEENVLVVRHKFRPFATGTDVAEPPLGILAEGSVRPLAEASALVRSLEKAWLDDIQVHAFATSDNGSDGAAVLDRLPLADLGGEA